MATKHNHFRRAWVPMAAAILLAACSLALLVVGEALADTDTTPPAPPEIWDYGYSGGTVSIDGSTWEASKVDLFEGQNKVATTTTLAQDCLSGCIYYWDFWLTGVSEGSHTYYATATDAAGNVSAPSTSVTVVVPAGTSSGGTPPPDTTPPTVQSVNPSEGATQVVLGSNVTAKFSEDVDGATLTPSTFMLGQGQLSSSQLTPSTQMGSGTTVGYDPTTQTATLNPYGPSAAKLAKCQWYTAKVSSDVRDKAGNPAIEKVWSFKTRGC